MPFISSNFHFWWETGAGGQAPPPVVNVALTFCGRTAVRDLAYSGLNYSNPIDWPGI